MTEQDTGKIATKFETEIAKPEEESNLFSEKIIRWSGLALALGCILVSLFWILHPEESILLTDPAGYQMEHLLGFIGLMLLIPGLIGLYARLSNQAGWLGFKGFLLTLLSLLVIFGVSIVDTFIWPAIARIQPDLILTSEGEFNQSSGLFAVTTSLIVPFAMLGAFGFILLGIAIWRSGLLRRWAGLILAIGGPLYCIGPGFVPHGILLLNLLVHAPFALAALWLGRSILNQPAYQQESMAVYVERSL
jgi:hypothetical protein